MEREREGRGEGGRERGRDGERFSKALRSLGLRKGHVVIVLLPNVVEYAIVALGQECSYHSLCPSH